MPQAPGNRARLGALLAASLSVACSSSDPASSACTRPYDFFANRVVQTDFGVGQDFGQSEIRERVVGPPKGGGCCGGSLDVTSLGEGGSVVLGFDGEIVDGDGPDFIVFENPFIPSGGGDQDVYAEIATVSVSEDSDTWSSFPCTETAYPFGSCAGWHPVLANVESEAIDPLDPNAAGGDAFDLAELGVERATFVRIEDRADVEGTFDLDAVAVIHSACASVSGAGN